MSGRIFSLMTTTALTVGSTVKVNGKAFRIDGVTGEMVHLSGPRGGWAVLVKNIKSGAWRIATERGDKLVQTFEVVA